MSAWEHVIADSARLLMLGTLLGLAVRGRGHLCWSFVAYLLAVLAGNSLVSFWPERFFVYSFWMARQAVYDLVKLAVALEIAHYAFRAFPGARATARMVVFAILTMTTAAIIRTPPASALDAQATFSQVALNWHPRILSGTIWLITGTALLVAWYRLPIHAFQRAVLAGFTAYLVLFTTCLNILRAHGWDLRERVNALEGPGYVAVLGWWCWASWRSAEKVVVAPEVARRLRLEHA